MSDEDKSGFEAEGYNPDAEKILEEKLMVNEDSQVQTKDDGMKSNEESPGVGTTGLNGGFQEPPAEEEWGLERAVREL